MRQLGLIPLGAAVMLAVAPLAAAAAYKPVTAPKSLPRSSSERRLPNERHAPVERPTRPVTLSVNGTQLTADESARIVNGRVLVPMRSLFASLHVEVDSRGDGFRVILPSGVLTLTRNSPQVQVAGGSVALDAPVQNIDGRVYVPLQLFSRVFGAITSYDSRNAHVTILSTLIARNPQSNLPPPIIGTVSNVDRFSSPPVVALVRDGAVRTVTLNSRARVYVQDIVAGTRGNGSLDAVHVGDILSIQLGTDGNVLELDDSFRSASGIIAAASGRAVALANGHLVVPDRDTTILLNGSAASLSDLRVGDAVTVRRNPETLEVREVIASREAGTAALAGPVKISQCTFTPERPLRADQELDVFLRGTPHGSASFDIGVSVVGVPMTEVSPGLYRGVYLVAKGASFSNASVLGHLRLGAHDAATVEAQRPFSAATVPPQVIETAPRDGQSLNNVRPSIYASFEAPTGLPIDPESISIFVGGRDVTNEATRTPQFVSWTPPSDFQPGTTVVDVSVADLAGNQSRYRWSFSEGR